ncbi:MAG: hypothetical protein ACRDMI_12040 [Streptosporangiaceae bacterium]
MPVRLEGQPGRDPHVAGEPLHGPAKLLRPLPRRQLHQQADQGVPRVHLAGAVRGRRGRLVPQQRLAPLGEERLQVGDGRVVCHALSSYLSSTKYETAGPEVDGAGLA